MAVSRQPELEHLENHLRKFLYACYASAKVQRGNAINAGGRKVRVRYREFCTRCLSSGCVGSQMQTNNTLLRLGCIPDWQLAKLVLSCCQHTSNSALFLHHYQEEDASGNLARALRPPHALCSSTYRQPTPPQKRQLRIAETVAVPFQRRIGECTECWQLHASPSIGVGGSVPALHFDDVLMRWVGGSDCGHRVVVAVAVSGRRHHENKVGLYVDHRTHAEFRPSHVQPTLLPTSPSKTIAA